MISHKSRTGLDFFYPYPESTGYTQEQDVARFRLLAPQIKGSVLDIGCGVSSLLAPTYGIAYNIRSYTGVDIRPDTLELAARTYPDHLYMNQLPRGIKYDTVLLLGVNMFNINRDTAGNKRRFAELLQTAAGLTGGRMIFSVCKEPPAGTYDDPSIIKYSYNELEQLCKQLGDCSISNNNALEYFVLWVRP